VVKAGRIAAGLAGAIALVLVLAQLLLPGIAASRISSRVGRYGTVESVRVSAWPAIKLLWGHADSVTVRTGRLTISPRQTAKLLWDARDAASLNVTAPAVQVGRLPLRNVSLRKRGSLLTAEAEMTQADVRAALPPGLSVHLLSSGGGNVKVKASGGLFGLGASVDAVAGPSEGKLIARPLGFLLGGLRLMLFADPHVQVEGVGANALAAATGAPAAPSYRLTMTARLR
jgi:LmeA-like phospholipid-binding